MGSGLLEARMPPAGSCLLARHAARGSTETRCHLLGSPAGEGDLGSPTYSERPASSGSPLIPRLTEGLLTFREGPSLSWDPAFPENTLYSSRRLSVHGCAPWPPTRTHSHRHACDSQAHTSVLTRSDHRAHKLTFHIGVRAHTLPPPCLQTCMLAYLHTRMWPHSPSHVGLLLSYVFLCPTQAQGKVAEGESGKESGPTY